MGSHWEPLLHHADSPTAARCCAGAAKKWPKQLQTVYASPLDVWFGDWVLSPRPNAKADEVLDPHALEQTGGMDTGA